MDRSIRLKWDAISIITCVTWLLTKMNCLSGIITFRPNGFQCPSFVARIGWLQNENDLQTYFLSVSCHSHLFLRLHALLSFTRILLIIQIFKSNFPSISMPFSFNCFGRKKVEACARALSNFFPHHIFKFRFLFICAANFMQPPECLRIWKS